MQRWWVSHGGEANGGSRDSIPVELGCQACVGVDQRGQQVRCVRQEWVCQEGVGSSRYMGITGGGGVVKQVID